jgi:hypothetical protein
MQERSADGPRAIGNLKGSWKENHRRFKVWAVVENVREVLFSQGWNDDSPAFRLRQSVGNLNREDIGSN